MSKELISRPTGNLGNVESTSYRDRSESRLADYLSYCQSEYNIQPELAELISTCLIPCHPHRPIWLVIETNRHPFWVHLSAALESLKMPHIYDCATLRHNGAASASYSARNMAVWLETRDEQPRITVDTRADTQLCWRGMHIYHPYWLLCTESVRAFHPVEMLRLPAEDAELELARLLKLVIDPAHRRLRPNPIELPENIRTLIKALANINREICLGPALYENLALIPASHAVLHGRDTLDSTDWQVLRTVLAGSIKQWQTRFLKHYFDHVMGYAPIQFMVNGRLRADALLTVAKINDRIWPHVGKAAVHRLLEPLMEAGIVKKFLRGDDKLYDVTAYGEMLANLVYEPTFDLIQDLKLPEPKVDGIGKTKRKVTRK